MTHRWVIWWVAKKVVIVFIDAYYWRNSQVYPHRWVIWWVIAIEKLTDELPTDELFTDESFNEWSKKGNKASGVLKDGVCFQFLLKDLMMLLSGKDIENQVGVLYSVPVHLNSEWSRPHSTSLLGLAFFGRPWIKSVVVFLYELGVQWGPDLGSRIWGPVGVQNLESRSGVQWGPESGVIDYHSLYYILTQ